jgi:hypothetical protein
MLPWASSRPSARAGSRSPQPSWRSECWPSTRPWTAGSPCCPLRWTGSADRL